MSCPVCFFRDQYQSDIKHRTFGIGRFERKLELYRDYFIHAVSQLGSLRRCACYTTYNNPAMVSWTDFFLSELQGSMIYIENAFNGLIAVYDDFIRQTERTATKTLWDYIQREDLLDQVEGRMTLGGFFYRARTQDKDGFDETEIREYFHIPFSKRHCVGNQRFSISGHPMLYFGSSVLTVIKEMQKDLSDLVVAAFVPRLSAQPGTKLFSLTNHINSAIELSLPGMLDVGSALSYDDPELVPNRSTIKKDIYKVILMNVCTFPVEFRGSFVAEYAIPQMLTTALIEHGYAGVVFPSTKDFSDLSGQHAFSSHHLNLGLFVPYDKQNESNEVLLSAFWHTTVSQGSAQLTVADLVNKCEDVVDLVKRYEDVCRMSNISSHGSSDYRLPTIRLKLSLKYLERALIGGIGYYTTDFGQLELQLSMAMLNTWELQLTSWVRKPRARYTPVPNPQRGLYK